MKNDNGNGAPQKRSYTEKEVNDTAANAAWTALFMGLATGVLITSFAYGRESNGNRKRQSALETELSYLRRETFSSMSNIEAILRDQKSLQVKEAVAAVTDPGVKKTLETLLL